MIQAVKRLFSDLSHIFFPKICVTCDNNLNKHEEAFCTNCLYFLPRTNFHLEKDNPVSQLFWGKVPIENASAYYHFNKGSKYQKVIHKLKYKGHKEIGYELGKLLGVEFLQDLNFREIDAIIPVPLHSRREKQRGYNQSEWIAKGLSTAMNKPYYTNVLLRKKFSDTQTNKTRVERWENVKSIFALKQDYKIQNKHILLVDDVITTGATLEACATSLLKVNGTKVSVATLAFSN